MQKSTKEIMIKKIKHTIRDIYFLILSHVAPVAYAGLRYKRCFHKPLNWKCPTNIDEKINWLKFNSDTTEWTRLADKYRVRDYVEECGLSNMLVRLYGKWDDANDIEWDKLPDQFVLKVNNGSGDILLCRDKNKLDKVACAKEFNRLMKLKFGYLQSEPHYNPIKPCVIAEELLDNTKQHIQSSSLIDYKIWAFNGKPAYIQVFWNRTKDSVTAAIYDLDWNFHPEYSVPHPHYHIAKETIARPENLDEMINAAAILSKGFPQVRVDLYDVGGKAYFGELTFTSGAGWNDDYTEEFRNILGSLTEI